MQTTKDQIMQAAADLFAHKGFAGTSISDIAKAAKVNPSLIYHYVESKQALWKAVKKHLIEQTGEEKISSYLTFQEFLESVAFHRLDFYSADLRIGRLIQWQLLEDNTENLTGDMNQAPAEWIKIIKKFQEEKKLSGDFPPQYIALLIHSSLMGVLLKPYQIFELVPEERKAYIGMIVKLLSQALCGKGGLNP